MDKVTRWVLDHYELCAAAVFIIVVGVIGFSEYCWRKRQWGEETRQMNDL